MKKKVIAAGHICLDITPVFPDRRVETLGEVLTPGKLLEVGAADVHTGGSVANTGLAMKLLGADVTLMGKIGKDAFGDMVLGALREYGAAEGMVVSAQEDTSYSIVLAAPGIDRVFLHNPGANQTFRSEDIPEEALKEAALLHFGYPPLMRSMYQEEGEELWKLFRRAKACGAATSLDMAAIDENAGAGQADWQAILARVLPFVDFFVPSVEELCCMLDRERFREWQSRAAGRDITEILDIEKDVKPLAGRCMELGVRVVLIKCGAPGMYYRTAGEEALALTGSRAGIDSARWANREGFEAGFVPERILSGTGAGDTSIAAFLTAMLEGYSPEEAVRLAAATGACCVEAYDALTGLKSFARLEEKIAAGWERERKSYAGKYE